MSLKPFVAIVIALAACTAAARAQSPAPAASAAAAPAIYDEPFRPQVHFSPRQHWTNDPNGLVFFHGEYHLFFQYNPFGDQWGHMSWGHAVSRDLLHWHELPVALAEQGGEMVFTGSVVVDHNTSGLCGKKPECLVAIYTGHRPGTLPDGSDTLQTQNLAASLDDGRTWTRYAANPVLDLHMADFRDPSVSWDDATKRWIMAVSLPRQHIVRLYASPDLKVWTQLSDFGPAGDIAGDWECPDLLHVPAADGHGPGMWAMKIGLNPGGLQGGSGEQYFLGSFDGHTFTTTGTPGAPGPTGWTNYGKDDYCAISFNGLPKAEKPVLIGWMSNWEYAAKLPTAPWRGQMSLPRRLSVLTDAAGTALQQDPITEPLRFGGADLPPSSAGAILAATDAPFELLLQFNAPSNPPAGRLPTSKMRRALQPFGLRLHTDADHWTDVGFDLARGEFYIDRTHSGLAITPAFPARVAAPLARARPTDLRLIVDRSSVEAFAQSGTLAMTELIFPPTTMNRVEVFGTTSVQGRWWSLHSIWK